VSGLPAGWEWSTVGEIAATSLGKMLDAKQATGQHSTPYLRNINVRWGHFDLDDVASMDIRPEELERVLAQPGDIIVCEGGEPGRAAVWRGPNRVALQKALHKVRPNGAVAPDFLALSLRHQAGSGELAALFTGTTIRHLPQEKLRLVRVPLPPRTEQERIVVAIEEAFSKLDAGEAGLQACRQRLKRMRAAVLAAAVTGRLVHQDPTDTPATKLLADLGVEQIEPSDAPDLPESWEAVPLREVAAVRLGRQRSPARAFGPRMRPYLRAANVGWDGLRLDDVKEMSFTEAESEIFDLVHGDLLLSEASGSPGEVGKPAQYRDEVDGSCCFQNTLIRVRMRTGLDPDYYEHFFRNEARTGKFAAGSRGVGIHHLGQKALNEWLVPVPPPEEQSRIVAEVERQLTFLDVCERTTAAELTRSAALRRSVLKSAFEGRLAPQDPSDEPASVLLDRIRADREAAPKPARRSRRTA
jgi:type I restriction enzyme S subunit